MISKKVFVALALMLAIMSVADARVEGPADMENALRMLQELDRYYTQASRPRIGRRDVSEGDRVDPDSLERAVRLLQLQTLDRIYSYHTRPRYGKRVEEGNWQRDPEKPDMPAWLRMSRR